MNEAPVGSPPRAWGPLHSQGGFGLAQRFTPTAVGTTRSTIRSMSSIAVHPHGRGDHFFAISSMRSRFGSPPRAWGPHRHRQLHRIGYRFTPTGVGTTTSTTFLSTCSTVHPHGRGDHEKNRFGPQGSAGSPPRAWGPLTTVSVAIAKPRFTPTGVGTTFSISMPSP